MFCPSLSIKSCENQQPLCANLSFYTIHCTNAKKASGLNVFTRIFSCVFVKYNSIRKEEALLLRRRRKRSLKKFTWHTRWALETRGVELRQAALIGTVPSMLLASSLSPLKHWNGTLSVAASAVCFFFFSSFFLRAWNVSFVMSNFPGWGVFVGQMQFEDCMKTNRKT